MSDLRQEVANTTIRNPAPAMDEKTVKSFLVGSKTKLTDSELNMFVNIAVRNNLDPFKREIYVIKYGNDFNIITGYQVYIKRAQQSGFLDGWQIEDLYRGKDSNEVIGARVLIHRKDWAKPFTWVALRSEWDKGTALWKKSGAFMIKKVAICQGFRLAFPDELGGLPYAAEEIAGQKSQEPVYGDKPATEITSKPATKVTTKGPADELADKDNASGYWAFVRSKKPKNFEEWMGVFEGFLGDPQIVIDALDVHQVSNIDNVTDPEQQQKICQYLKELCLSYEKESKETATA